jgi:hypothetical protein
VSLSAALNRETLPVPGIEPLLSVRFQVLTAASMIFRVVFRDILPCKIIVDRRFRGASLMMEAVRTSETSFDNSFTRQYIPEDNSEHHSIVRCTSP